MKHDLPDDWATQIAPSRIVYARQIFRVFADCAFQWTKNVGRRMLGRPHFEPKSMTLCSQNFWQLVRFRRIEKVTVSDYLAGEGAGSKALMVMFTISMCRAYCIRYVHTPFKGLGHAEGDQEKWDAQWERFFNLGLNEEDAEPKTTEAFDYFLLTYLKAGSGDWTRFIHPPLPSSRPCYYLDNPSAPGDPARRVEEDRFVQLLTPHISDFKARYRHNKPVRARHPVTVCIHIRRGDVEPGSKMWTDLAWYSNILDVVSDTFNSPRIWCFSQGNREDFRELERHNVELFLDMDAELTMQNLIEADVLVIAKSCFSYVAAMLSDAVVIFESGHLPGFDEWIRCDHDGRLDAGAFKARFLACDTTQ